MFTIRFDMRAPEWGAPIEDLYAAAIDMAAWAESRGAIVAVLSEHHATADRHLPSPLVLASAIAARTETLVIMVAAAVLPFYDTARLAEDMGVLNIISRGRVSYVLGVGHRREEYDYFGVDWAGRGANADAQLARLLELLADERPQLFIGGGSEAAAKRAGRFGLGLIAQLPDPRLADVYEEACRQAGHEPGFAQIPEPAMATAMFVADDVDAAWDELGPHLLHDAMTAASYRHGQTGVASISTATTIDELRPDPAYRIVTVEHAAELVRGGSILPLLPLCGGLSPEVAWPYLHRAAHAMERATLVR